MYEETVMSSCVSCVETIKTSKKGSSERREAWVRLVVTVVGSLVYVATLAAAVGYGLNLVFMRV